MDAHEINVGELLEGATTLLEAAEKLQEKALHFESLAGQGFRFKNDEVKDGYGWLIKPDNTLTNDRDRLAMAFMDLQHKQGFTTPLSFAWEASCIHEAGELLETRYPNLTEDGNLVFWVSEVDDDAFGYQGWSDVVYEAMPDDAEERRVWVDANLDFIKSQEISERLSHHTLIAPLPLYWRGDCKVAVAALREHGLTVIEPDSIENCIVIVPGHIKLGEDEG